MYFLLSCENLTDITELSSDCMCRYHLHGYPTEASDTNSLAKRGTTLSVLRCNNTCSYSVQSVRNGH